MISAQQLQDLSEHARRLVADWPPLTPECRQRLSALFQPSIKSSSTPQRERKEAA